MTDLKLNRIPTDGVDTREIIDRKWENIETFLLFRNLKRALINEFPYEETKNYLKKRRFDKK